MDEDEGRFLDELGRFAREQEAEERRRFDERFRRLAEGTISEEDDAALRAMAGESDEARLDYEVLRPLGAELHERMVREWQTRTRLAAAKAPPAAVRSRRRSQRAGRWLALAATLVVALAGWWLLRGPDRALHPLPEYRAELDGYVREMRSSEATPAVRVFLSGSPFRLELRPRKPIEDESLELRLYLEGPAGQRRRWWDLAMSDGAVVVEGTLGEGLPIGPGDQTFIFVYGRSGRLPDAEELGTARPGDDWDWVRVPFRIESRPLAATEPRLEVELAGCLTYFSDLRCYPGNELTLWVRVPAEARLELRLGDRGLDDPGVPVDGGRRFKVAASPDDGQVEVRAASSGGEETWILELIDHQLPDWLDEAIQLFFEGDLAAARDLLESRMEGAAPVAAALAHANLARLFMRLDEPDEEIQAHLEAALELHRDNGDLLNLARDVAVAVYLDLRRQRFLRALERLDELSLALDQGAPFEALYYLVHNQVTLERKRGNFRRALELVHREADLAWRMGLSEKQALAEEMTSLVLQDLGRFHEAHELLRGLESAHEDEPCSRLRVLGNRAWVLIRASDPALGDPLPLLAESLDIAEREECGSRRKLDVLLNQALAFVEGGRTWEGLRALESARDLAGEATPLQLLWWEQIEGLLALRDGRGLDALERFERLEELSLGSLFLEGRWLAKLGQARAHRLLGEAPAALAALEEAGDLLDHHSLQVPLHQGRGPFMAQREEGARLHLEMLLEAGRVAEALEVARRSRARILRGLRHGHRLAHLTAAEQAAWNQEVAEYLRARDEIEDQADNDWRLSAEELEAALERRAASREVALRALDRAFLVLDREGADSEPPPLGSGEAVLVYHPLPRHEWVGFAADGGRVDFDRFELPDEVLADPGELARRLLEPFRETLDAAGKVRILAVGRLSEVDFHAFPWDGDVFLAGHPVVYGLDLAIRPAARSPGRALVVADPRGDLPAAHEEGEAVAEALSAAWDVLRLPGDAASPARIRELAGEIGLFHYAGHGVYAGPFGWESALVLAGEGRLTLGDVLALERAPARVVLSSCESARASRDGAAASLGLAQAFLVAGSQSVVAAVRPVGDRATAGFFRELYREDSPTDLGQALRRAQLAWRQSDPRADWQAFRVLEP